MLRLRPPGGKQMDKKIAALLGAAAALTTMSAAQSAVAEPTQNTPPTSYRDLLEPIPDALNALKIDDARIAAAKTQGGEQVAQYHHHHHHHHHTSPLLPRCPTALLASSSPPSSPSPSPSRRLRDLYSLAWRSSTASGAPLGQTEAAPINRFCEAVPAASRYSPQSAAFHSICCQT